jgi:predicted Zn-dependent protease with MMP-like domain
MQEPDAIDQLLEGFVIEALEGLPPEFLEPLGSVAIVVEPEASPAQLQSVGAAGLYGLYQGVPRTAYGASQAPVPSKITLFRGPLLRSSRSPEQLRERVIDTVYHEIAHHFGISDARLRELERGRRAPGGHR